MRENKKSAALYIVSTPIGNLSDITYRAVETLQDVSLIYCEDTRQTAKLCARYTIKTRLKAYHEHNAASVRPKILNDLEEGNSVALVSDAGTPLIADPGYKLVQSCLVQGITVHSVPGACAPIAALTCSGFPTDQFMFLGFMPKKATDRKKALELSQHYPGTLIFFEVANRLRATLKEIKLILTHQEVCVARELTKAYEEVITGPIEEVERHYLKKETIKGEIVLLIKGQKTKPVLSHSVETVLAALINSCSVKEASQLLADITGLPKGELYQRALELKNYAKE